MKPDWDKLGADFAGSKTVVIGDVDCTVEKDLCSKYGVRGYPTIKYFTGDTAADGDKYEGGRDYDTLKSWADENLGPSCSPDNRDLCSEEQLAAIDEVMGLATDALQKEVDDITKGIEDAEANFKAEVAKLQAKYQELMSENEKAKSENAPRLKLVRSVLNFKNSQGDKSEL